MSTLFFHYNLFDRKQSLILMDETGEISNVTYIDATKNISDMGKDILQVCSNKKVTQIHLFGQNEFVVKIKQEIKEHEKTLYGKNILRIEVN